MKVYTLRRVAPYDHPGDMELILEYLKSHGDLHVSGETVESLWYKFSDKYAAGWLSPHGDLLPEFAEWLDDYEL